MKVFKFGGASVNSARGVANVAFILQSHAGTPILIVVSAMGKTTNALERILNLFREGGDYTAELTALKYFHASIMNGLFRARKDFATADDVKRFSTIEFRH